MGLFGQRLDFFGRKSAVIDTNLVDISVELAHAVIDVGSVQLGPDNQGTTHAFRIQTNLARARFAGAEELAVDIQRHDAGIPVIGAGQACPLLHGRRLLFLRQTIQARIIIVRHANVPFVVEDILLGTKTEIEQVGMDRFSPLALNDRNIPGFCGRGFPECPGPLGRPQRSWIDMRNDRNVLFQSAAVKGGRCGDPDVLIPAAAEGYGPGKFTRAPISSA